MLFNLIICDYFLPRGQLKTTSKSTKTSFQTLLWKIFWILLFFYETLISIFIIGTYGATYKKIHAPKETSLRWQFWSRYFIDLHCFHFHTHVLPFYFFSFTLITKIISVPLSRLYIQIKYRKYSLFNYHQVFQADVHFITRICMNFFGQNIFQDNK